MSIIKNAKRWLNRWSKFYTGFTISKITFSLRTRYAGKSYLILQRLKKPRIIRAYKKLALYEARMPRIRCTRKNIKRRVVK